VDDKADYAAYAMPFYMASFEELYYPDSEFFCKGKCTMAKRIEALIRSYGVSKLESLNRMGYDFEQNLYQKKDK